MENEKTILKFGIPGFDGLFNNSHPEVSHQGRQILNPNFNDCGISIPKDGTASICIIGPDGVGKSVFAMHLASRYCAENQKDEIRPSVFYISTDLNHEIANEMWKNFALNLPAEERDPFSKESGVIDAKQIDLEPRTPNDVDQTIASHQSDNVIFVDLASNTAGDDWGFLHRFISILKPNETGAKHLIIIDAVEGFETYVGETDGFGEQTSRRARIAQIMRLVKGKSHVLIVVEESKSHERLPEEFVTDVVIRLSKTDSKGYLRRTLEIEKARGQYYARGLHQYTIRNGKGSTTGEQENADDPKFIKERGIVKDFAQSYVFVPHSLHYFNRTIMVREGKGKPTAPKNQFNAFGIEYLDNMLGGEGEETNRIGGFDSRGLPAGTITALIGDTLTQKSRLGRAFLSQAFNSVIDIYQEMKTVDSVKANADKILERIKDILDLEGSYDDKFNKKCLLYVKNLNLLGLIDQFENYAKKLVNNQKTADQDNLLASKIYLLNVLKKEIKKLSPKVQAKNSSQLNKEKKEIRSIKRLWLLQRLWLLRRWITENDNGVALMITTNDINHTHLVERFLDWLKPKYGNDNVLKSRLKKYMLAHTICRRIEIHDISSSIMLNIFSKSIYEAQKKLLGIHHDDNAFTFDRLGRIRMVIDDFSAFRNVYSDITDDNFLLPSIKFILGRSSVSTLIIDTQTGKPDVTVAERFASESRQMADNSLYTWRVPFYGENRVAITAIPPLSADNAGIVRELKWEPHLEGNALSVDPHFEMYLGLEEGKTQPIPVEIRLFADIQYFDSYLDDENLLLSEIFTPNRLVQNEQNNKIIIKFPNTKYDILRNMSYLQRDTRLDHTVVTGVDEFWGTKLPDRRRSGSFCPQWRYLDSITTKKNGEINKDTDPYSLFQKGCPETKQTETVKKRRHFFDDELGYELNNIGSNDEKSTIERVPYSWDFGFILCKKDAWLRAADKKVNLKGKPTLSVGEIWNELIKIPNEDKIPNEESSLKKDKFEITWRIFLDACQNVSEAESDRLGKRIPAFDSSLVTPETFSCLFLEIWASEIYQKLKAENKSDEAKMFSANISNRTWSMGKKDSLIKWVNEYPLELYKTWLLLIDVLNFSDLLQADFGNFEFKTRLASNSAIAVRLWYKTACHWVENNARSDSITAVRLPGNFSIRGDWFLSTAGGSRSIRLGERVLDIFCSRRANIVRLQQGLGLPTRHLENNEKLRTGLVLNGKHGKPQNAEYEELKSIGAKPDDSFFWLWRSNLNEYHRHSRVWHKWLNRVLHWWFDKKIRYESSWDPGFETYDLIMSDPNSTKSGEKSIRLDFFRLCNVVKNELESASSITQPTEENSSELAKLIDELDAFLNEENIR